jgi:hypothetical protein
MVQLMSTSGALLDKSAAAESHELDRATCMWLLATEQVGRLLLLECAQVVVPVNYVVVGNAIVVRVDAKAGVAVSSTGSPVAFDVDVFDVFSQVGWRVHVRGDIETVVDVDCAHPSLQQRLRPWIRQPGDRWIRISAADVRGHWFRPPEQPRPFAAGYL